LKAKSLTVNVEMIPLIFSRAIHITGLTIDEPNATLLRSPAGTWNFSTLGAKQDSGSSTQVSSTAATSSSSNSSPDLSVGSFSLKNGTMVVGNTGATARTHTYSQVNLKASDLSYTTQFPFQFTANTPGNGSIKLDGKAGPLNPQNTAATPLNASVDVKSLDLKSTGFIDPSAGISGVVDFSGTLNSDGTTATSNGKLTANHLQLVPAGSPAAQPVQVDYDTSYELKPQTGQLKSGTVHIGKATANLTGGFNNSGAVAAVEMKLVGQNMPAADLETVLPAIGVTLPSGASLTQGTLNANLAINGPVDKLVITGPVDLSNAKLTGFDLGSKLGSISALSGIGKVGDTEIQLFSTTVRVAPEGIRSDNLNVVLTSLGSITGKGTISPDHKLDFNTLLHLGKQSAPSGQTLVASNSSGGGIPLKIEGTTSDPQFRPDLSGMAGSLANGVKGAVPVNAQNAGQEVNKLGGLFGKKK
jgi:AsmA protein